MRKQAAKDTPVIVTGTFSIQTQAVDVLFDLGAMHSFIFVKLVETLGLVPTHKPSLLSVILPNGKTVRCEELYEDFPIRMYEHEFLATYIGSSLLILRSFWGWISEENIRLR